MLAEWQRIWPHLAYGSGLCGLAGTLAVLRLRLGAVQVEQRRERLGREEMEAYVRLDLRLADGGKKLEELKKLGRRVTGVIAVRSPFSRVAMLARDAEGTLLVAASEGMDEAAIAGVERWLRGVAKQERATGGRWNGGLRVGSASQVVLLEKEVGRAIVVPVTVEGERLAGALLVCAESVLQVPRRRVDEAVAGLEALALRLGRAMEEVETGQRPVEKPAPAPSLNPLRKMVAAAPVLLAAPGRMTS